MNNLQFSSKTSLNLLIFLLTCQIIVDINLLFFNDWDHNKKINKWVKLQIFIVKNFKNPNHLDNRDLENQLEKVSIKKYIKRH